MTALNEIDPNPLNNSSAAVVNAAGTADLRVTKTVSNRAPAAGDQVTYTIAVTNLGPDSATSTRILDALPAGLTFMSATASQGTYDASTGEWTLGIVPVVRSATLAITARLDQPRSVTNVAALQASAPSDPNPANDAMSAVLTPAIVADLAVTITPGATSVNPGATLTWTMVVNNDGPGDAAGATVTSAVSPAFTGASWTCTVTPGSACAAASGAGSIATTVTLVHGGSATFKMIGSVSASATGTVVNTTSVAAPPGAVDPAPANNTATSSVAVQLPPSPPPPVPPSPVPPPQVSPPHVPAPPAPPAPPPAPPPETSPPPSAAICAPAGPGSLDSGDLLSPNETIASNSGRYQFVYQSDGNLVLYDEGIALWSTDTNGITPGAVYMQGDGNLVLYDGSGAPVWASGTAGDDGAFLAVQDDGNVVIYRDGVAVWATNTVQKTSPRGCSSNSLTLLPGEALVSQDGHFALVYQGDGNLVVYEICVRALWASGTAGSSAGQAVMQGDGNLVVYDAASRVVFASRTSSHPGARLVMQNDGNLVISAANGIPIWSTQTSRR
ncbi:MAG: DUF11 domain-containing protein [Acidobacteria bacterium]|nr:DUF11 domain-containing protein [Acidobacteriota bacterium]